MDYTEIAPCDELKDVISHFWVCSLDTQAGNPGDLYYIVANTLTNITFAFADSSPDAELLFSIVEGHTCLPRHLRVKTYRHLLGVSIHSHALPRIFPVASPEVSAEVVPTDTFLARDGAVLNEQIAGAGSVRRRIAILTAYFRAQLSGSRLGTGSGTAGDSNIMLDAVEMIRNRKGNVAVVELAERYHLSRKHFNRRFREFTGFTPKKYGQVVRFESVIENYPASHTLTDLAHATGYFDQAHFNHEFRAFTGLSPTDFWKLSEDFS